MPAYRHHIAASLIALVLGLGAACIGAQSGPADLRNAYGEQVDRQLDVLADER